MKKRISVFKVKRDPAYSGLKPKNKELFDRERSKSWRFDGTPPSDWKELEMEPTDTELKTPDIWEVVPGVIALERAVAYELGNVVYETQHGVSEDLRCGNRKLDVINSTQVISCLDETKSKLDEKSSKIVEYSFDGKLLAISLFKIPQTSDFELYAIDGFDKDEDFKTLVEKFGFTGLVFEFLWSGNSFMDE